MRNNEVSFIIAIRMRVLLMRCNFDFRSFWRSGKRTLVLPRDTSLIISASETAEEK